MEGLLGMLGVLAMITLVTMFISWIFGANIGSKYSRNPGITPDDLPNAVNKIKQGGIAIANKLKRPGTSSEERNQTQLYTVERKLELLEKFKELRDEGVIKEELYKSMVEDVMADRKIRVGSSEKNGSN